MANETTLLLQNGATIEVPRIYVGNGWVYRPDQARTQKEIDRGINRSFSRSTDWEPAEDWLRQYIQNELDKHDWAPILKMDINHSNYTGFSAGQKGMMAAYFDQHLGWQNLTLDIQSKTAEPTVNVRITWNGWNIQEWYRSNQVPRLTLNRPLFRQDLSSVERRLSRNQAYDIAARFAKNPIEEANKYLHYLFPDKPKWQVHLAWPDKPTGYSSSEVHDAADGVKLKIDQEHIFWKDRKHAQKVLMRSENTLRELASALQHHGVRAKFDSRRIYDRDDPNYNEEYLYSASFEIPATSDDDNKLGHSFSFTEHGMSIECGFIEDEQRWEDTQKRHLTDWLKEMNDAPPTKEYEDYEYKPNV
jgi:hypothetical protein